jgi:hypothetical protein
MVFAVAKTINACLEFRPVSQPAVKTSTKIMAASGY